MAIYYFRNAAGNWNAASSWSLTDGGPANGAVPTAADDAYFTSNSGSCTVNINGMLCKTLIFSGVGAGNYTGTFTMSFTLTVSGNITLSASMTLAGSATLTINAASTITSNGKTIPFPITVASAAGTITLGDNMSITGLLTLGTVTINSNTLYIGGSMTQANGTTSTLNCTTVMNGSGTLTSAGTTSYFGGSGNFVFNTTGSISVNALFLASSAGPKTVQYVAGDVYVLPASVIRFFTTNSQTLTLDLKGMRIFGATAFATQGIISLVSDLVIEGGNSILFGNGNLSGAQPVVINSAGGDLYFGNTQLPASFGSGSSNANTISGTAKIYVRGGGFCTWSNFSMTMDVIFNFSGLIRFTNFTVLGNELNAATVNGGTWTYLSGRFDSVDNKGVRNGGILRITGNATFIGFNRVSGFGTASISTGLTLTMDEFFSGSPTCPLTVTCNTATGSYTITFQDQSEKIANWVKVSNCTLSRRGQLLILNQKANGGRNTGVRYQNAWPNGAPKAHSFSPALFAGREMTYGAGGVLADPAFSL